MGRTVVSQSHTVPSWRKGARHSNPSDSTAHPSEPTSPSTPVVEIALCRSLYHGRVYQVRDDTTPSEVDEVHSPFANEPVLNGLKPTHPFDQSMGATFFLLGATFSNGFGSTSPKGRMRQKKCFLRERMRCLG